MINDKPKRLGCWAAAILLCASIGVVIFLLIARSGEIASAIHKGETRGQNAQAAETETMQPEATETPTVTVIFDEEGKKTEVAVMQGELLELAEAAGKNGYRFIGWKDEGGSIIQGSKLLPKNDAVLRAVYFPILGTNDHRAYLPMDASWRSRPDEPITRADVITMLYNLTPIACEDNGQVPEDADAAVEEKAMSLLTIGIVLEEGKDLSAPITREEFLSLLNAYGPIVSDTAVLVSGEREEAAQDDAMTRLEIARIMNAVMGRSGDPAFLEEARTIIRDLPENDEDAIHMLEACLNHEHTYEVGTEKWAEAELPELPFPGFTTGDIELDAWLKQIIDESTDESHTLKENLSSLYRYVRDNFRYRKGEIHTDAETDWVALEARKMMDEGGGNCFTYASTLCELYRAIGLDANVYAGSIAEENQPHAWVEATVDGVTYIFDVEMEWTRMRFHQPYVDFFMRTYYDLKGWNYQRNFYM